MRSGLVGFVILGVLATGFKNRRLGRSISGGRVNLNLPDPNQRTLPLNYGDT